MRSYQLTYDGNVIELGTSHRETILCLPLQQTKLELAGINEVGVGNQTTITIPAASSLNGKRNLGFWIRMLITWAYTLLCQWNKELFSILWWLINQ